MDLLESYKSIYFDLLESHYKVGDKVTCKESGMTGKVVKVDSEEEGKYYTVKREDGKSVKYAPDELKKGTSPEEQKEGTDLFDYVLEYLVAEGYADTNENALVIMANMSEEWRQSIVEAKVDKKLPEYKRSGARLDRYDNPSGALALGGGQQRARRAEHEERRGKKK
jgi:hypothetical protein